MQDLITNYWANHSTILIDIGYNILLASGILLASTLFARGARRFIRRADDHLEKFDETLVPGKSCCEPEISAEQISVLTLSILIVVVLEDIPILSPDERSRHVEGKSAEIMR